ncbi:MAG: SRPBCC domain-containing protein [Candidatus Eremiobacteraeota bacterium]|nr:SRPBCC domain-containing protein [Candidatus Eremiobacteraeota bacterium]
MSQPSVVHGTFVIERAFEATPTRVFAAFSSSEAKSHWFGTDDIDQPSIGLQTDFRIGGRESWSADGPDGNAYKFEASFEDIVTDKRIVSTYKMWRGEDLISVSVASVDLRPEENRTHLTYTEHGAFIDGRDEPSIREHGTREMFGTLARYIEAKQRV